MGTQKVLSFWKSTGAVIFIVVLLIVVAQYGSKKAALAVAGLIFLSTLIFNIEKLKGVFSA